MGGKKNNLMIFIKFHDKTFKIPGGFSKEWKKSFMKLQPVMKLCFWSASGGKIFAGLCDYLCYEQWTNLMSEIA